MKQATIYHNNRCSKSREALDLLSQAGIETKIVKYLETPPTPKELDELLKVLGAEPRQIVRTKEPRYAELELDTRPPKSRDAWLKLLSENPILIERPIVTDGKRAVVARPPEKVLELLKRG